MVDRDAFQWFVDSAAVGSGLASLAALILAGKALRDSRDTANHLAETIRLADVARLRADREQAAHVLSIAEELLQQIRNRWQASMVHATKAPTPGPANEFQGRIAEDLKLAEELYLRASGVDLTAAQYAYYIRWRLQMMARSFERVSHSAARASPAQGGNAQLIAQHQTRWEQLRLEILYWTLEIEDLIQRLYAHFPTDARLMSETDAQGFLMGLHRQLERGHEARARALIQRVQQTSY